MDNDPIMNNYIVNCDISHYLLQFVPFNDFVSLLRLNFHFYQLMINEPIYFQLQSLKSKNNKLRYCYQNGFLKVLQKLHLSKNKIYDNQTAITAAEYNQLAILEWLHSVGIKIIIKQSAIIIAAKKGYLQILDFYQSIDACFLENTNANPIVPIFGSFEEIIINNAAAANDLAVLDWFFKYDLANSSKKVSTPRLFDCFEKILQRAAMNGQINVFHWFHQHHFNVKNQSYFDAAVKYGHLKLLHWFESMGISNCYTPKNVNEACVGGYVDILKYLKSINQLNYDNNAILNALDNGHLLVWEWFKSENLPHKNDYISLNIAAINGHVKVLHLLEDNPILFVYSQKAVDGATSNGHLVVLDWFHHSRLVFKYSEKAIHQAVFFEQLAVLDWFEKHHYPIIYNKPLIASAVQNSVQLTNWFKARNIYF